MLRQSRLHPKSLIKFIIFRREKHNLSPSQKLNVPETHVPVLLNEVLENLAPVLDCSAEPTVVDMTFGCGGHTSAILNRWPRSRLICLDRDPKAFDRCKALLSPRITPFLGRFRDLPSLMSEKSLKHVDVVLFDLGVSTPQFDDSSRGFSLSADGPLDMRMDGDQSDLPSAADVVNQLPVTDLAKIIKTYGEEHNADEIARAIVDFRNSRGLITRTAQLAGLIRSVSGDSHPTRDKLNRYAHPATRTFQALRIFVNDELNDLCYGLENAHDLLKPQGRCLVISFHSLEDRIVKRIFHAVKIQSPAGVDDSLLHSRLRKATEPLTPAQMTALISRKWKPIAVKGLPKGGGGGLHNVIVPSQDEIETNPKARSAKLRVAEKN